MDSAGRGATVKELVIYRYDYGKITFGVLFINGKYVADTLELPWKDNAPKISCIPEGIYSVKRIISPHNGDCLSIGNVPNRVDIEMHIGNVLEDTEGCILVGIKRLDMVFSSRRTLKDILSIFGEDQGSLEVRKLNV